MRVFIGLVSHRQSTFAFNQGPQGLTRQLETAFGNLGAIVETWINTENYFDRNGYALKPSMARQSISAEVAIEKSWQDFLFGHTTLKDRFRLLGRQGKYLLNWWRNSDTKELRRLLNIEYSHVDLYKRGLASKAEWIVVLEDDAYCENPDELAQGLFGLFEGFNSPKFINLTTSFPLHELNVASLLTPVMNTPWLGLGNCEILQSSRPATNTVCAIAFRRDFLKDVLSDFQRHSSEPVIPIDWKLNKSIMNLWRDGLLRPNDCWFLEPGPIIQLSMNRDQLLT